MWLNHNPYKPLSDYGPTPGKGKKQSLRDGGVILSKSHIINFKIRNQMAASRKQRAKTGGLRFTRTILETVQSNSSKQELITLI